MRPSPATTLHDVLVTNDQTGAQWHARAAAIVAGRIEVTVPRGQNPTTSAAHTFTITATDGGGRQRTFANVTADRERTTKTRAVFV